MTTRVRVTNEDCSGHAALVTIQDGGAGPSPVFVKTSEFTLIPGASTDVWIHGGRRFVVEEIETPVAP